MFREAAMDEPAATSARAATATTASALIFIQFLGFANGSDAERVATARPQAAPQRAGRSAVARVELGGDVARHADLLDHEVLRFAFDHVLDLGRHVAGDEHEARAAGADV